MSQRITTTSLIGLREIGTPAERALPRVDEVMRRALQGRVNIVLAEPIPRSDGQGIDWYTEHDEPLTRLNSLPPEQADYYRSRLRADIATMAAVTADYEARGDKASRATAGALRAAMTYPGDDHVWLAGDVVSGKADIILTSWGYDMNVDTPLLPLEIKKPGEQKREPGGDDPDTPKVPEVVHPTSRDWGRYVSSFLWLLAFLLPLVIGWILIPACGVRLPFTDRFVFGKGDGLYCRQLPNPQLVAGRGEAERLTTQVADVTEKVRTKIAQCVPPAPVVQQGEDAERLKDIADVDPIDPNENSVSLTWNNRNDLDLYIVCPDGNRVPLGGSGCGFKHEVDMNMGGSNLVSDPVEYIRQQSDHLMPGTYKVEVVYFSKNDPSPDATDFVVTLRQDGRMRKIPGSTSSRVPPDPRDQKEVIQITEFTVR
ncbi:hypothetical protein [Rhizobium sp. BK176]|uniref:hypothetical protein n=1 Tax=Rhizobium sp. BK176 TaxID=2587071 RepID=UPI00216A6EA5|nr:hypothetical protein [Rhizobium sp. BK176]MCS4090056.1 hypothetical protein [Rhizobium sp. BK176]